MKVLSLFDGMACGMLAMKSAGIPVDKYTAYEVDKYAIETAKHNFPEIEERGDVFSADFNEFKEIDFLIGGSPCTYWSIAQTRNRETVASGMGWELFSQYVRALRDSEPRYFLYENNKSMSAAIRSSITETFGFEPILINSALVSAQNRQRLYWCGVRQNDGTYKRADAIQPEDRGIVLKDILESNGYGAGVRDDGKAHVMTASYNGAVVWNSLERHQRTMVAEPVNVTENGKSHTIKAQYYKNGIANFVTNGGFGASAVAEPIKYCNDKNMEHLMRPFGSKAKIITKDEKAPTLMAAMGTGGGNGVYYAEQAEPVCVAQRGRYDENGKVYQHFEAQPTGKTNNLTTVQKDNLIAEPIKLGEVGNGGQGNRVYSVEGKSVAQTAQSGGLGSNTGLYAIPAGANIGAPIYEVSEGMITVRGKRYPIKLADGHYVIRKLTVTECKRLQTVPEDYEFPVSNSQAYKMLGNGWTVEVIAHLLRCLVK